MNAVRSFLLPALLIVFVLELHAQPRTTGLVTFNVGRSPVEDPAVQPVSLFGCNNVQVDADLFWDTEGQVVGHIPFGPQTPPDHKPYFVSKYYVASPPVYRRDRGKEAPFIGLVTPDRFTLRGDRPAQIVNLDYRILEPTFLHHVAASFDYPGEWGSCREQGVEAIPINTDCPDFPWRNGGLGASGIGQLTADGGGAFVPSLKKKEDLLQCSVTLLDDVVLEAEVFFAFGELLTRTLNLTEVQEAGAVMNLVCVPRGSGDLPAGCSPPLPSTVVTE